MPKFRQPYDYTTHSKDYEKNTQPSKTIPDQTMSIPELIRRYASGLPLGGARVPMYEDDPEQDILNGRNWSSLDLTEKHDFIRSAQMEVEHIVKKSNPSAKKQKAKPEADISATSDIDDSESN
jgi:hypothetical protein